MAADTQLDHLGGLLKAALQAVSATACIAYFPYRLPSGASTNDHPCLELYRERETFISRGNRGQRLRNVTVQVNYYAGPAADGSLEDWAGTLASYVQTMDNAIEDGEVSGYHSGDDLYEMAAIEGCAITSVEYDWGESGGAYDGAHPAIQLTLTMQHRYTREAAPTDALAGMDLDLHAADATTPAITDQTTAATADDSGTDGVIVASTKRFSSATAAFVTADVGKYIWIADAVNAGNNAAHEITARVSGTVVTLGNATTLANEATLHWSLLPRG